MRIDVTEHGPGSVVETPGVVQSHRQGREQFLHATSKAGIAGRGVLHSIQLPWESAKIMNGSRRSADRYSDTRDELMRRNRENGFWFRDFGANLPPRFGVDFLGDGIHGIAMSKEDGGQHFWRTDSHVTHENAWL